MTIRTLFCLALCAQFSLGLSAKAVTTPSVGFAKGDTVPPITATDQYGKIRKLSSLAGKWVVLAYVARWEAYSQKAGAQSQALVSQANAAGVPFEYVTAVLEDRKGKISNRETGIEWSQAYGVTSPVLNCEGLPRARSLLWRQFFEYDVTYTSANAHQENSFPIFVVIDPNQVIQGIRAGELKPEEILATIQHPEITFQPVAAPPVFGLQSASLTLTYGEASGSRAEPTDDIYAPGAVGPTNRLLTSFDADSYITTAGLEFITATDTRAVPMDRKAPITMKLENVVWKDGLSHRVIRFLSTVSYVTLRNREFTFAVGPMSSPGDEYSFGPFLPKDFLRPAPANLFYFKVQAVVARRSPLSLVRTLHYGVATSPVPFRTGRRLLASLERARAALAPDGDLAAAGTELVNFKSIVAAEGHRHGFALIGDELISVADDFLSLIPQ